MKNVCKIKIVSLEDYPQSTKIQSSSQVNFHPIRLFLYHVANSWQVSGQDYSNRPDLFNSSANSTTSSANHDIYSILTPRIYTMHLFRPETLHLHQLMNACNLSAGFLSARIL